METVLAELGLSIESVFVPVLKGTPDKKLALNWRVTVKRNGRAVLETPYSQGVGHCPAYKATVKERGGPWGVLRWEAIRRECETGCTYNDAAGVAYKSRRIPGPSAADVLSCLAMDASAIDYATFEDWASEFGCDPDSRKGEAVYRACLEIGLKLRAALGEAGLVRLREAAQDF